MLAPRPTVRGPLPKIMPVLAEALQRRGCEVVLFPWGRRSDEERLPSKLIGRAQDVVLARRGLMRGGFLVVVVHTGHDWLTLIRDLALLRMVRRPNRATIVQFHGSQSTRLLAPGSWPFKRATAALLRSADGVLVLSREEQAQFRAFSPQSRVFVVRNPVAVAVDNSPGPSHDGTQTILCVARLIREKGVIDLVQALPLVQRRVRCRLVLAGDGPEKEALKQLAIDLGVTGSVELPGYVEGDELAELYRGADVFALPTSHPEGFPTAILEAMTAALPIVTTPSRGQVDHLVEGRHALFVPPHDLEALAACLTRLLTDDDLRRSMGEANRRKVRDFDPDSVAAEYLAVLDQIVAALSEERRARLV